LRRQVLELTSPVHAFVEERCDLFTNAIEKKADLYQAYKKWCKARGKPEPDDSVFFRDLLAAYPALTESRPRDGGSRIRCLNGIRLNAIEETDDSDREDVGDFFR